MIHQAVLCLPKLTLEGLEGSSKISNTFQISSDQFSKIFATDARPKQMHLSQEFLEMG